MEAITSKPTIDVMLGLYGTVLDGGETLYCSAPITSGKRFIDWLDGTGKTVADVDGLGEADKKSHFREVVRPNCTHAREVVLSLRRKKVGPVIDPTAMSNIPGWSQQDWRVFWRQVIEMYATATLFVDDWQYSNGCVYEFWVAHKKGIPTFDERMEPLSITRGISLIGEASTEMEQRGASTVFVRQVLQDLMEFSTLLGGPSAK